MERERLIANEMLLYKHSQKAELDQRVSSITADFIKRGLLRSSMYVQAIVQAYWDMVSNLVHRLAKIESEIPGGPPSNFRERLEEFLANEIGDSIPQPVQGAVERSGGHGGWVVEDLQRRKEQTLELIRVLAEVTADRHTLGLLAGDSQPGGIYVGTIVVGSTWYSVDSEMLADMVSLLTERLREGDRELREGLQAIAEAIRSGKKKTVLQQAEDTLQRLDKAAKVLGPMAKFAVPMLQRWLERNS